MRNTAMKITHIVFVAFSFAIGSSAVAAERDHDQRVLQLVRLIDQAPTAADLSRAGAGDDGQALSRIARDRSLDRYARARAASLLALFPATPAELVLGSIAGDATFDDVEVRIAAVAALSAL